MELGDNLRGLPGAAGAGSLWQSKNLVIRRHSEPHLRLIVVHTYGLVRFNNDMCMYPPLAPRDSRDLTREVWSRTQRRFACSASCRNDVSMVSLSRDAGDDFYSVS